MPTYDFQCQKCNKNFTVMVSLKDKDKTTCPQCGSKEIKQQFKRINVGGCSSGGGSCSSGCCSSCSGCS